MYLDYHPEAANCNVQGVDVIAATSCPAPGDDAKRAEDTRELLLPANEALVPAVVPLAGEP
jgi:hypothetical protein